MRSSGKAPITQPRQYPCADYTDSPSGRCPLFAADQPQIARIIEKTTELGNQEGQAHFAQVEGVDQGNQAAADAEIPECHRDDAAPFHLALEELDEETRCEQGLADEADSDPDM